jgi:Asp-tRNA(Asn)/Glu-tRNA(Gln) amidotransferase A subunit family amidase
MDPTQLNWLSATDAARAIAEGAVSSEQLVEACLERVPTRGREVTHKPLGSRWITQRRG